MIVEISGITGDLPGQIIIRPETELESLVLRIWSSWPEYAKKPYRLIQGNVWTGNKGVTSVTIQWNSDKDPLPAKESLRGKLKL